MPMVAATADQGWDVAWAGVQVAAEVAVAAWADPAARASAPNVGLRFPMSAACRVPR
jgi:hypothetical protein